MLIDRSRGDPEEVFSATDNWPGLRVLEVVKRTRFTKYSKVFGFTES